MASGKIKDVNSKLNSKERGLYFSKDLLRDEHTLDINQDIYCALKRLFGILPGSRKVNQTDGNLTIKNIKLYTYRAQNKLQGRKKSNQICFKR